MCHIILDKNSGGHNFLMDSYFPMISYTHTSRDNLRFDISCRYTGGVTHVHRGYTSKVCRITSSRRDEKHFSL